MKSFGLAFLLCFIFSFTIAQEKSWEIIYKEADSLMQKRDFKTAIPIYEKALVLAEKEFGKNTEQYLDSRNGLGRSMSYVAEKEKSEAFFLENLELCKKFNEKSAQYATSLHHIGTFYLPSSKGNNPSKSEEYLKTAILLRKEVLGEKHPEYANSLNNLADLYRAMGNYTAAEPMYKECLKIRKEVLGEKHPDYAASLNNLASLYLYMGNYTAAEPLYKESLKIYKEVLGEKHPDYATSLNNLAVLYLYMGNYTAAEPLYKESLKTRKEVLGEKHPKYAASLNNLAILYRDMGNYIAAEPLYKESLKIRKEVLGEKHPEYASSLNNLAALYFGMGNYTAAEPLYKESLKINKEVLGKKHPEYAASLNNLAVLYRDMGNYIAAEPLYKESLKIKKEVLGEKHPEYAASLNNLAALYFGMGNYTAAEPLYKESLKINKEVLGEKHPEYATFLNNLANLYSNMGNYTAAEPLYKESLKIRKEVLGEKHPEYANSLNNLAGLYYTQKNYKQANAYFQVLNVSTQSLVQQNFSFLSEKEKTTYFDSKIKELQNIFTSFAVNQKQNIELYNQSLFYKGILLSSAQKIKNRILASKDSSLKTQFEKWTMLKMGLAKYQQMDKQTFAKTGLRLDSLENAANEMEKALSLKSESFAKLTDKTEITWQNIQKKLNKNEAAIEIVRFNTFGISGTVTDTSDVKKAVYRIQGLTDTVQYAALIIRKNSKKPELVVLENGNELETKFAKYQKNMILYKQEDILTYNEFWKPIAAKLKGIKKVYFSPDGVYNQISLNTLQNPETKKYVLEEIELHLVTNTKDILVFGKSENNNFKAELLGYPIYDLANFNKEMIKTRGSEGDSLRAFANFNQVALLPGTKKEVEDIIQILSSQEYKVELLLDKFATEENIKKIQSPKILHLSTHGFFIDSKEKNDKINPMLRSGLLLTGVTDYARMEEKPDTEDGVLTALEAANLDLDETDLVVLSACETGLGDVKAGEGVYGLQRAFKVAGAKTLVMSMWKVDDIVTQKLMSAFYQKYAATNNARLAFKEAQAEIKLAYPEPYYWGAFIMVGE